MRKKVLFFADGLYGGGAEKVLQTLLQHLDKDKFEITLYSMKQEALNDLYPQDINYHYVFSLCSESASVWKKLRVRCLNKVKLVVYYHLSPTWFYRLFIKGKYDTEVAFIEGYATRIVSGSTNPQSKKIAWVHIDLEQNHWTRIAFQSLNEEDKVYQKFDLVCAVSKTVSDVTQKLFPNIRQSLVIYNPIDEQQIVKKSMETFHNDKWIQSNITFISVGRLVHQKGYDRLLPIFKRLVNEGYPISLNILGTGTNKEKLEAYIGENNLSEYISLLGYVNNPYPYMVKSDIFVVSSRSEGFSTVVSEALILGMPIVSTFCAGMDELLGSKSEYGILTKNDSKSLYLGIKKILDDRLLYTSYKEKARRRGERFKIKYLMQSIENIL